MFNKINSSKLSTSIAVALLSGSAMVNPAIANENEYYSQNEYYSENDYFYFPTGEHEGGGVRGKGIGCVALEEKNPRPFALQNQQTLTVSESPELLFYVPDVDQASTLDILLFDHDDNLVNYQEFQPGNNAGIVGINLVDESNDNALELDSSYSWYLVQECAGAVEPRVLANGSLKRVELNNSLANQLKYASPSEKAKLYRGANIWHEAISNIVRQKCGVTAENTVAQPSQKVENVDYSASLFSQSIESYCSNNLVNNLSL